MEENDEIYLGLALDEIVVKSALIGR